MMKLFIWVNSVCILGTMLLYTNLSAQNYVLEFEAPNGFSGTQLTDNGNVLTTDGMDLEGDGILELIVQSDDSILVFDGSSHLLKWQFKTSDIGDTDTEFWGFYDIDGDGTREAIFETFGQPHKIVIINPQTNNIEFTLEQPNGRVGVENILDLDNDGLYELIVDFDDGINSKIQIWGSGTTSTVSTPKTTPSFYELSQNYPNPFNPSTTIEYSVQKAGNVQIKIHNTLGQLVRTLVNESRPAGEYSTAWDGKNDSGRKVTSGQYFYQLQVEDFISTKKMLLLK